MPAHQAVEFWPDSVLGFFTDLMAGAARRKDLLAGLRVASRSRRRYEKYRHYGHHDRANISFHEKFLPGLSRDDRGVLYYEVIFRRIV
jgi:hypothetical protein